MNTFDELETYKLMENKSLVRFGDGEFYMMCNKKSIGFQIYDDTLCNKLKKILLDDKSDILIGIPPFFSTKDSLRIKNNEIVKYWMKFLYKNNFLQKDIDKYYKISKYYKLLNENIKYCSSFVTRIESFDNVDSEQIKNVMNNIILDNEIIIITNEITKNKCFDTFNKLFINASKINYLIIPHKNAYSKYDDIYSKCLLYDNKCKFFIMGGPMATVLAYELHLQGYHALDIGHLCEIYMKKFS